MGIHNDKRICRGHILVLEFSGYLWSLLLNSVEILAGLQTGDSTRVQRLSFHRNLNMWLSHLFHLIFLLLSLIFLNVTVAFLNIVTVTFKKKITGLTLREHFQEIVKAFPVSRDSPLLDSLGSLGSDSHVQMLVTRPL